MASIFKRNGRGPWHIAYFDHTGKRRERSARTTCKATADRIRPASSIPEAIGLAVDLKTRSTQMMKKKPTIVIHGPCRFIHIGGGRPSLLRNFFEILAAVDSGQMVHQIGPASRKRANTAGSQSDQIAVFPARPQTEVDDARQKPMTPTNPRSVAQRRERTP